MGFAAFFIIGLTFQRYRELAMDEPMVFVYKLFHRVIFDSAYSLRIIFNVFDKRDFLYGSSYWWDLYSKLPGQRITFQSF